jgi:antitoxin component YwqK of YwqJK toxin-antitoxin module
MEPLKVAANTVRFVFSPIVAQCRYYSPKYGELMIGNNTVDLLSGPPDTFGFCLYARVPENSTTNWLDFKWISLQVSECADMSCDCEFKVDYSKLTKRMRDVIYSYAKAGFSYFDTNGLRQGVHLEYFDEGMTQILARGCYLNNKGQGRWIRYYADGTLAEIANYDRWQNVGLYELWWENGSVFKRGTYGPDGKETGFWSEFCQNGKPRCFWTYLPDNYVHVTKYYCTGGTCTGVMKSDCTTDIRDYHRTMSVFDADFPAIGPVVQFYDNGQKSAEWTVISVSDPLLGRTSAADGIRREWYPNGSKKVEFTWVRGLMDGPYRSWYDNGDLKEVGQYKIWLQTYSKTGHWLYYAQDGTLLKEEDFP